MKKIPNKEMIEILKSHTDLSTEETLLLNIGDVFGKDSIGVSRSVCLCNGSFDVSRVLQRKEKRFSTVIINTIKNFIASKIEKGDVFHWEAPLFCQKNGNRHTIETIKQEWNKIFYFQHSYFDKGFKEITAHSFDDAVKKFIKKYADKKNEHTYNPDYSFMNDTEEVIISDGQTEKKFSITLGNDYVANEITAAVKAFKLVKDGE